MLWNERSATWHSRLSQRRTIGVAVVPAGALTLLFLASGLRGEGTVVPDQQTGAAGSRRFDMVVREDFFSGFAGDAEALERGMKKCEDVLARDAKNPVALVWHGAGMSYSAKKEFMTGNIEKGRQVQAQGVAEMNEAVALRPDDVGVLIPRASVFLSAATHVPSPEVAKQDFQIAADDYEKVLKLQSGDFAKLPVHARGELLGGLAEAWNGLGDAEKSRGYLKRIAGDLGDTAYGRRAKELLAGPLKPGPLGTTCLGCHSGSGARR